MATLFSKVKAAVKEYNSVLEWEKRAERTFDGERNNAYNALVLAYKTYLQNDNQTKVHKKLWIDDRGFIRYDPIHFEAGSNIQLKEFQLSEGEK